MNNVKENNNNKTINDLMQEEIIRLKVIEHFLTAIQNIKADDIEFFDECDNKIQINNVNEIAKNVARYQECDVHVYVNNFVFSLHKEEDICTYESLKYDNGQEELISRISY